MSKPRIKVYCVQRNGNKDITRNYTYFVVHESEDKYHVRNDNGKIRGYEKELFKIIE